MKKQIEISIVSVQQLPDPALGRQLFRGTLNTSTGQRVPATNDEYKININNRRRGFSLYRWPARK